MKLELKHLAPYLPYNLTCQDIECWEGQFQIMTLEGLDLNVADFDRGEQYDIEKVKPILRPLSDLTKEIEVNGEKFVPGLRLVSPDGQDFEKMVCEFYNPFPRIPNHHEYIRVHHKELGEIISINPHNIEHLPYHTFKQLFEWHFDVFGLIPAGLAIDINTLNK